MDFSVLKKFDLRKDKETRISIRKAIENDAVFEGTNLWILFFAILIASLGLNTNSTAVIIGAMLISPLMGPIVGIGFSVATRDLVLLRSGITNYLFALVVGLIASTIYFLISPIESAHSEILARTQPTVFDVLIALFGGFAGFIAVSSKNKGNVIPGVAIATALMPPLCTAGYGLATLQIDYFLGAVYLFWINSVFIALATIISAYLLKFPTKDYEDKKIERRSKSILYSIVILTLIPSIYFGYRIVQYQKFISDANNFISQEAYFENNYLLKKDIDEKSSTINLTYGGQKIAKEDIDKLSSKMKYFNLSDATLKVQQGFSLTDRESLNNLELKLQNALAVKENENKKLNKSIDSLNQIKKFNLEIGNECKILFPEVDTMMLNRKALTNPETKKAEMEWWIFIESQHEPSKSEKLKVHNWLEARLKSKNLKIGYSN
ncbi:MAG: DUF389 domain-containing protein [Bacteroidota bacterium]